MIVYQRVSFLNIVLWSVNAALCVPSGKCSVCVHSTHFWYTVWKVFCFCAQFTFLMYHLESVLFLCTVHIYDVPSGKCSVSVHNTHFWCTVWEVFCFCAQYTFMMCHLESVLFLCTVHISDAQWCDISLSNRTPRSVARGFVLLVLLPCDINVVKTVPVPVETCNRKFVFLCMLYEIFAVHPL